MVKPVDITVLNIDDQPIAVESLPDEIKDLVGTYNDWNRKEADVRDELLRFQAAKETLSRQIVLKVNEFKESNKETAPDNETTSSDSTKSNGTDKSSDDS